MPNLADVYLDNLYMHVAIV